MLCCVYEVVMIYADDFHSWNKIQHNNCLVQLLLKYNMIHEVDAKLASRFEK